MPKSLLALMLAGAALAQSRDDIPEAGLSQNPDFLAHFAGDDTAVKLAESGMKTQHGTPGPWAPTAERRSPAEGS